MKNCVPESASLTSDIPKAYRGHNGYTCPKCLWTWRGTYISSHSYVCKNCDLRLADSSKTAEQLSLFSEDV